MITYLAKLILRCIGWKLPTNELKDKFRCQLRGITLFSHTTYCDFFLLMLYGLTEPEYFKHIYTIMHPGPFKRWGWLLKRNRFIQSTRAEDSGCGFVNTVIEQLNPKETLVLLISPEGKLTAVPWRSGYFYIAKGLNCPIRTAGFDYEKKELIINDYHFIDDSVTLNEIQALLQHDMGKIVPLYVEGSYVKIREHNPLNVSIIRW